MSFDGIEKKSADENTELQLKGAAKQLRAAATALENALRLGGSLTEFRAIDDLTSAVKRVQQLTVINCYRQKVPYVQTAALTGLPLDQVMQMLMDHFQDEPQLSHDWLTAEREIQKTIGPGETPRA